MRMLVVGAGSTGGYFGGRLAQAGRDVTFLVRPKRAALLRAAGLQIVSPHGDATLHPRLVTADQLTETFDAVLLTVKAFVLEEAIADFAPAIGKDTMILPVLNGMRHMDRLAARFGAHHLAGCAAKIATQVDDAGRIVQLTPLQDIAYGEMDGADSGRIRQLHDFMTGAGFDARLSQTIELEMWEKWVLLASVGAITCAMRGTIGDVAAAPGGKDFARGLLAEVVAIVRAEGHNPGVEFLTRTEAALTADGSPLASSMYRDLKQGDRIEADQIVGDLLARGERHGVAAPLLKTANTHLGVYSHRWAAK